MRHEHDEKPGLAHPRPAPAHDLTQAPPRPIALHGAADALLARDESHARRRVALVEDDREAVRAAEGDALAADARIVATRDQSVVAVDAFPGRLAHPHEGLNEEAGGPAAGEPARARRRDGGGIRQGVSDGTARRKRR